MSDFFKHLNYKKYVLCNSIKEFFNFCNKEGVEYYEYKFINCMELFKMVPKGSVIEVLPSFYKFYPKEEVDEVLKIIKQG